VSALLSLLAMLVVAMAAFLALAYATLRR